MFSPVPAPCFIQLDEQPQERLLDYIYVNHDREVHAQMMQGAGTTFTWRFFAVADNLVS